VLAPTEARFPLLHPAPDLTVLHVVWAPTMDIYPARPPQVGGYGHLRGGEDNAFYRRTAPEERTLIQSAGKQLTVGDTVVLGDDTTHARRDQPTRRLTGTIHVSNGLDLELCVCQRFIDGEPFFDLPARRVSRCSGDRATLRRTPLNTLRESPCERSRPSLGSGPWRRHHGVRRPLSRGRDRPTRAAPKDLRRAGS
jgi:hypothetical protein